MDYTQERVATLHDYGDAAPSGRDAATNGHAPTDASGSEPSSDAVHTAACLLYPASVPTDERVRRHREEGRSPGSATGTAADGTEVTE